MKDITKKSAWRIVLVLASLVLSQCAPAAPAVPAAPAATPPPAVEVGPTPEATGLAEYVPPGGGLLDEIKKRGVLRNGVECQNPPGEFFDTASGKCTGYSIELAEKLAAYIGVKLEVIDTAWSGVIPSLYTNNFDLILSSMTIRDDRKKAVNFSMPVGCDQVSWIVRSDDNRITKPEDLAGMTVATQLNSAAENQAKELETQYSIKYAALSTFDHFDGAYLSLKNSQADIATSTAWNNIPLFKAEPGAFKVAFTLPNYNYVGIAIRKQDTDLLAVVNKFLKELEATGDMADLQFKYYGYGMTCGEPGPNVPADWTPPSQASGATEAPAAAEDATLIYAVPADARSLDPSLAAGRLDVSIVYSTCDLLAIRDTNGVSQPHVAESWTRIDPNTWEFKIRKGITFTNGEPLDAKAVKFTMERARIPEFNDNYQLPAQTKLKEVKIIDDYTVQFITEEPTNTMEFWLAESPIIPPKYYGENSVEAVAEKPVCSGAYKFVEWVKDDHITLERNDDYWGPKPAFKNIIFKVIPEASARINELRAGNIDIASALSLDQAEQANSDVSVAKFVIGLRKMHMGIVEYGDNKALKDKGVRQALNYAIDKEALVSDLLGGRTDILKSYVNPPNSNPELQPYPYDPKKAKALLAKAGYANGFDVAIEGRASSYGFDKEIMTAIAEYLKAVGVNATVNVMENGVFLDALDQKKLTGLHWMGWAALINPIVENLILTCGHVDNAVDYCNPEFDKLYNKMVADPDPAARQELNFQMQKIAWDDAPWLFLWHLPQVYGVSKDVDWQPRPDGYIYLWEAKTK